MILKHANTVILHVQQKKVETMLQIKRILAPIDFSGHAEQSLAYAREIAFPYRALVDLLHVIEEPTFPAMYGAVMNELYGKIPNVRQDAVKAMQALLARSEGPDVETGLHVVKGRAGAEILRFVQQHDVDLVVMPTHGLTGLEHLLMGSVAEKVVRQAPCPVLVVKAFGKSLLPL